MVELSYLKTAGQTYFQLLEEMIEERKKARFFRYMEKIDIGRVCGVSVVVYQLVIKKEAFKFVNARPSKSQRIVIEDT